PRAPRREPIFHHPLPKRLCDDRPTIVDPNLVAQPGPVRIGRLRCDAIDHRVREGARSLDETDKLLAPSIADTCYGLARDVAVAWNVVATQDGQWRPARRPASLERGRDRLDRRVRVLQGVAALGDRHRQDRDVRPGNLLTEGDSVTGDKRVADDA